LSRNCKIKDIQTGINFLVLFFPYSVVKVLNL